MSTLSTVAGLSIEFMGVTYANNSAIATTEVGEDDNTAVLCRTDLRLTACCGNNGSETNWRYPNGMVVEEEASMDNLYSDNGDMVVSLYISNITITPTGLYCCELATMHSTMENPSSSADAKICITLCKYRSRSV